MSEQTTFAELRRLARTDSAGHEKEVLSLHDRIAARVLAPPVAWLALRGGMSADVVTAASVLTAVAGAGTLAWGALVSDIVAVLLLQFSYVLDCADGDMARARGTSSVDGALRDTLRHYLVGPLIFCGLTVAVFGRHPERAIIVAGLLGAVFATRMVGDLDDRVTLEGLIRRLKRNGGTGVPAGRDALHGPAGTPVPPLNRVRALLLPDLAIMDWVTVAVLVDVIWLRHRPSEWLALDAVFIFLAAAQVLAKTVGLLLLWRRGVSKRVERLAQEVAQPPPAGAGAQAGAPVPQPKAIESAPRDG